MGAGLGNRNVEEFKMDYSAVRRYLKDRLEEAKFAEDANRVQEIERLLQKVDDNESDYGWLDYID